MQRLRSVLFLWWPALIMMVAIFGFSSQPAAVLPSFGSLDYFVKKGGHFIGFGLLSLAYWRGFRWQGKRAAAAWLLAVVYAVSDELHQAWVPGRHPSVLDVVLFDSTGAALALWIAWRAQSGQRAAPVRSQPRR
jgi:VanZ family protein